MHAQDIQSTGTVHIFSISRTMNFHICAECNIFKILCMRNVKWKSEEKNNLLKSAYISIRVWAHGIYLVLCQLSAICNKKPTDRQLIIKNWIFESAHKTVQIHLKVYSEESNTAKNPKMLKWNIIANNSRNH